jgi:hypothetical protein
MLWFLFIKYFILYTWELFAQVQVIITEYFNAALLLQQHWNVFLSTHYIDEIQPRLSKPATVTSVNCIDYRFTRWFKYYRDKLWLVYTQIVPVIFEPPCKLSLVCYIFSHKQGYYIRHITVVKGPSVTYKVIINVSYRFSREYGRQKNGTFVRMVVDIQEDEVLFFACSCASTFSVSVFKQMETGCAVLIAVHMFCWTRRFNWMSGRMAIWRTCPPRNCLETCANRPFPSVHGAV